MASLPTLPLPEEEWGPTGRKCGVPALGQTPSSREYSLPKPSQSEPLPWISIFRLENFPPPNHPIGPQRPAMLKDTPMLGCLGFELIHTQRRISVTESQNKFGVKAHCHPRLPSLLLSSLLLLRRRLRAVSLAPQMSLSREVGKDVQSRFLCQGNLKNLKKG